MCLAIPGQIVETSLDTPHSALIDIVGVRRRVDISLVEPEGIAPGDWVLIHVGFAMSKISDRDAVEQLRMLNVLGEAAAAMEEVQGYSVDESDRQAEGHAGTNHPHEGEASATAGPASDQERSFP